MNTLKISISITLITFFVGTFQIKLIAQDQLKVLDKPWVKENTPTRRVVPYTQIREQDVMWHRRIWREIDLREKINHPLYFPVEKISDRKSLFDVIKDAVLSGELTAYQSEYDEFTIKLTIAEAKKQISDSIPGFIEDVNNPGEMIDVLQYEEVVSADIVKYQIKEDWFFDRERSIMDVRIIGIQPIKTTYEPGTKTVRGVAGTFWVYFPEARYVFANWDVFNRQNDAERRTYEDIFWKRMFNSYIIKRSNVYDRRLGEYKLGIDLLLEADQIKEEIFNMEHDVWHF